MRKSLAIPVVALILGAAACGSSDKITEDGQTENLDQQKTHPGYSDVFVYCHGDHLVFLTKDDVQASSSIAVVPNGCHKMGS